MLVLTATDLLRFMVCNGSRLMPENPRFNVDDTVRNEGNAAHWLIEQVHKQIHGTDELLDKKAPNGVFITEEMVEYVMPFLEAIRGRGDVELDTSYSDGKHYRINGRADHIEYDKERSILYVRDFKYGWTAVEPEYNWTLISHAMGYIYPKLNGIFPAKVVFQIFQPRPHHPLGRMREWSVDTAMLNQLFQRMITVLSNPSDVLNTSKECKDCPARATCPAAQKAEMNAIDVSEKAFVSDVDDKTLGILLDDLERALKILEQGKKAYSEMALHRLKAGKIIPGYSTEKELTNKQWKEGITVETAKLLTGKDLGKKQMMTPAQAAKEGVSEAAIESLCERRQKGVKLVRLDADAAVKKMFGGAK